MNFHRLTTEQEVLTLLKTLPQTISLDCETNSAKPRHCELLSVVLGTEDSAYSIPAKFIDLIHSIANKHLILQYFKFDFKVLKRYGLDLIDSKFRDIFLLHHLIPYRHHFLLHRVTSQPQKSVE